MAVTARERKLLIGGEWVDTGDWIDIASPYSGETVGRVAKAGTDEARRAVDAAERAMAEPLPAHKRAEILVRVAGYLGRRHDEVARTVSDEAGKPMKAARVEARRAMSTYTFAAVEARKLAGEMVPMDASQAGEGKLAFTLRRPIGVVGAVSPFNFPLNLVAHKLAPALAAGGAVVLKPASQTQLSAPLRPQLEEDAGPAAGWVHDLAGVAAPDRGVLRAGAGGTAGILEWIEGAGRGGAEVLAGGEEQDGLIRRTVIAKAGAELKVSCDEVFGPVVTVNAVDSLDEAIERGNGTRYGLQAGIFTSAIETALRAARALDFGGVTVNEAPTFRTDQMPYGGVKDSGNTREGPHYAVRELTEERLVVLQL